MIFKGRILPLIPALWIKGFLFTEQSHETHPRYKTITDLKNGLWQPLEMSVNDLANIYMQVRHAEGKTEKDVEFMIDNVVCGDGDLKNDPCVDPDAPAKSLADAPIWSAKKPEAAMTKP